MAVTPADFDSYCLPLPVDPRLPNGGQKLCGFYDIKPSLFGVTDNLRTQASNYGNRTENYNGVDVTLTSHFGNGGYVSGGVSVGRTVTDACELVKKVPEALFGVDSQVSNTVPGTLSSGTANSWSPAQFCRVSQPWSAGTQAKFLAVYPLPWGLQASATYQNIAGIPYTATYPAPNAQILSTLGRNVGSCRGAATCNANVNVELVAPNTRYENRLQQVDLRFTKRIQYERVTLRGNFDIYNVLNGSAILSENTGYGVQWLTPYETMGGRLFKFSTQFEF